jgi:PAS domain S-box-containing protein
MVLYANTRFAAMAETPLEQVVGASLKSFFPEQEHSEFENVLKRAAHTGVSQEFHLRALSGQFRPVWVSLASTQAAGIDGLSAVVTDLTERKAAEAKVREMIGELEGVSYAIVHDMRAPLRAMEAFAHMLGQDPARHSVAQRKDFARRITTAAARLDELIRDALTYNQVVLQPAPLHPIKLTRLLRDLLETYPNLSPERADISLEKGMPSVMGNEALLTQCFSNLLGNAVKFVAPDVRPRVRVRAESANDFVRIWIEDNGIGVPPHAHERLFKMFQRLTTGYEGTGIGLAIVRKVVERMEGRVGVQSQPGKGSRFWVELKPAQK